MTKYVGTFEIYVFDTEKHDIYLRYDDHGELAIVFNPLVDLHKSGYRMEKAMYKIYQILDDALKPFIGMPIDRGMLDEYVDNLRDKLSTKFSEDEYLRRSGARISY